MTAILYDTLRLSRTLRDKGHFTPEQAETLAEALGDASQDNLATKSDIAAVKADIKAEITAVKADIEALRLSTRADLRETELRLETKIEAVRSDLVKWMFGAIGFQTLVTIGAVFALAKMLAR